MIFNNLKPFEDQLKRFKKESQGRAAEARRHEFFLTKNQRRRIEKRASIKKARKIALEES